MVKRLKIIGIHVRVIAARSIKLKGKFPSAFCKVTLRTNGAPKIKFKTRTLDFTKNSHEINWKESFLLSPIYTLNSVLEIRIFETNYLSADAFVCQAVFPLDEATGIDEAEDDDDCDGFVNIHNHDRLIKNSATMMLSKSTAKMISSTTSKISKLGKNMKSTVMKSNGKENLKQETEEILTCLPSVHTGPRIGIQTEFISWNKLYGRIEDNTESKGEILLGLQLVTKDHNTIEPKSNDSPIPRSFSK
jgi:hypothetical protein